MEIARAYELAESQARQIEKDSVRPNEHKSVNKVGVYPNSGIGLSIIIVVNLLILEIKGES